MMQDHDTPLRIVAVGAIIAIFFLGVLLGASAGQRSEERICRHAIQRRFSLPREEAEKVIEAARVEE